MSIRKIVLLSLIGVLAVIYAGQLIYSGRNQVRELTLDAEPDTVVIKNTYGTVTLAEKDGKWIVSQDDSGIAYVADKAQKNTILRAVSSIKTLGTVSSAGDNERYGLTDRENLFVTVLEDGKILRSLKIGKTSVTAQHTYVAADSKKDILLVSGDLVSVLNKSVNDLRSKEVYSLAAQDIVNVQVTLAAATAAEADVSEPSSTNSSRSAQSYTLEKAGEPPQWSVAKQSTELADSFVPDTEKTASWINSLASLNVLSWAPDSVMLPDVKKAAGSVKITAVSNGLNPASTLTTDPAAVGSASGESAPTLTVTVTIFSKDDNGNYMCTSDAVPYVFYISSYAAEKYLKPLSSLAVAQ